MGGQGPSILWTTGHWTSERFKKFQRNDFLWNFFREKSLDGLARLRRKLPGPILRAQKCPQQKDADFVTTQFRVGLLGARIKDERLPLLHGMPGQETNDAGGMFKAVRTIPVLGEIVRDMKELCPFAGSTIFTGTTAAT